MKLEMTITASEKKFEEYSRDRVLEKYKTKMDEIYKKLMKIAKSKDTLALLKFQSQLERSRYQLVTAEWAKKVGFREKIGIVLKIPGLQKYQIKEERIVMYVFLAYSKGFEFRDIVDSDHPGDLERVIFLKYPYSKRLQRYYYLNTAGHGFPVLRKKELGIFPSFEDALETCELYLKPGDHAAGVIKKEELNILDTIKGKLFARLNASRFFSLTYISILKLFEKIRGKLLKIRKRELESSETHTFWLLEPEELKENLGIDLESYINLILQLDGIIDTKIKEMGRTRIKLKLFWRRIRNKLTRHAQKSERDKINRLLELRKILWQTPIIQQPKMFYHFRRDPYNQTIFDRKDIETMEKLEFYLNSILLKITDLKMESIENPSEFLRSKNIYKYDNLSDWGKIAFPIALKELFEKPLYDWAYPEKAEFSDKVKRIIFSITDTFYRRVQSWRIARRY